MTRNEFDNTFRTNSLAALDGNYNNYQFDYFELPPLNSLAGQFNEENKNSPELSEEIQSLPLDKSESISDEEASSTYDENIILHKCREIIKIEPTTPYGYALLV